jgi:outer membrane protein OmpA-like peptidoglycan-associated protein
MSPINKILQRLTVCLVTVTLACSSVFGQTTQPTWWFGISGAANLNWYDGTSQTLNNSLIIPTALHKGFGVRPYGSILAEYRPAGILGVSLNVGYDGRGAKFDAVMAPCNCPVTFSTNISYVTVEPSLRLSVPKSGLYFFAGPRIAFNLQRDFTYTQLRQPTTKSQLSDMKSTVYSGQVGVGYDIPLSSANSTTKFSLSPFVSYQPYFGQEPRNIESLSLTTVRAGIALKFGKGHKAPIKDAPPVVAVAAVSNVDFSVRAPATVPAKRKVSETFPLLNAVFFDEGSAAIPVRYIVLTPDQATGFKEAQLQKEQSENMTGRSAGQLNVYHNILNILGDRMRSNPSITITLSGSPAGANNGKAFAESIKQYLVTVFGIDGARIAIQSRNKPVIPSEQVGANKDLPLLRAEDRRVDIASTSPELLVEVGGGMMKPVQIDATQVNPMDSQVVFHVDSAKELLKSWSISVTDDKGTVQNYGPYTTDQESIPGATILGTSPAGDYKVEMTTETKTGQVIKKESSVHLVRQDESVQKGARYSIMFNFDKSKTIASYNRFLTNIVSPLIADGSTVIIHGHTDIIGEEAYNQKLSEERAKDTQKIIEQALAGAGKTNVKFETYGFGEDASHSPFENNLPEERFYNRTVIIDIVPVK